MNMRYTLVGLLGVVILATTLLLMPSRGTLAQTNTATPAAPPQSIPQIPMIVAGNAIGAPDGFKVVAKITKGAAVYESIPGEIADGRYFLKVAPPDARFIAGEIVFLLEGAEANESLRHQRV